VTAAVDEVHLWHFRLDLPPGAYLALLDPRERARHAARPRGPGRDRYAVAHGTKRLILGSRLGLPPARVPLRVGRWGKPEVAGSGLRFSLAHSGDRALLGVCGHREIGVDVERPRSGLDPVRFAARWFRPEEAARVAEAGPADRWGEFLRLWTRKEACVKAAGGRLAQSLTLPVGHGPHTVADPSGRLPGSWWVDDVQGPEDCTAAVALAGTAPFRPVPHAWEPVTRGPGCGPPG
jgi:Phosphopantetheinyl transferase